LTEAQMSLQDRYAPMSVCFGCGPANAEGLRIKSFVEGALVVADFVPETYQEAFPNVLSGGIIGTLLDCHCNWTAAYHLMLLAGADTVPATVTAAYAVRMRNPTPTDGALRLRARLVEIGDGRATVEGEIEADGEVTATCRGTFVAVGPDHPAFRRW